MAAVLFVGTAFAQDNAPVDESTILLNPSGQNIQGNNSQNTVENGGNELTVPRLGMKDFLKMLFFLALVILVIYLFFYFLKKISGQHLQQNDQINILGSRQIKGDSALHLVEVGNHIYLVGSGSSSVNLISEIEDKETLDEIRLNQSKQPVSGRNNFLNIFSSKGKFNVRDKDLNTTTDEGVQFLKKQRDKLKKL